MFFLNDKPTQHAQQNHSRANAKGLGLSLLLTSLFSLASAGCFFSEVSPNDEALDSLVQQCIEDSLTVDQALRCVPDPVLPEASEKRLVESINETVGIEDVNFECTTERYYGNENVDDFISLQPDPATLFVGNLVQGEHLLNGNLVSVGGSRAGGTVFIEGVKFSADQGTAIASDVETGWGFNADPDIVTSSGVEIDCSNAGTNADPSYSCTLSDITPSGVNQARRTLTGQDVTATGANMYYEIETSESFEELFIQLGINASQEPSTEMGNAQSTAQSEGDFANDSPGGSGSSGSVDFEFSLQTTKKKSVTVLKFVQGYYTMVWEPPDRPSDYFAADFTIDDILGKVGPGNPMAYISSVTYGRSIYLFVMSSEESQEITASLDAAMTSGNTSGEVNFEGCFGCESLQESKIVAVILGGSAEDAGSIAFYSTPAEIVANVQQLIADGSSYDADTVGAPIAYQAKWLATNEPAKMALTTDYAKTTCIPQDPNFKVAQPLEIDPSPSFAFEDSSAALVNSETGESFVYVTGGKVSTPTFRVQTYTVASDGSYTNNGWSSGEMQIDGNQFAIAEHQAVALGNQFYLLGGNVSTDGGSTVNISQTIYRLKSDATVDNTGVIDFTQLTSTALNIGGTRKLFGLAQTANHVYLLGGNDGSSATQSVVYTALNGSGLIDTSFSAAGNNLKKAVSGGQAFTRDGYVYYIGGGFVQYARIKSDGDLRKFTSNQMNKTDGSRLKLERFGMYIQDDYLYVFGGDENGSPSRNIYFAPFNADGPGLGDFETNTKTLEQNRSGHVTVSAGGYIYNLLGGGDSSIIQEVEVTGILEAEEDE